jgi:hypothetical protein
MNEETISLNADQESLLPPHIRLFLADTTKRFAVPVAETVFCAGACGKFLGASTDAEALTCGKCKQLQGGW